MKSNLSVCSFMGCSVGVNSEKSSPNPMSPSYSYMLSSIDLHFIFRSMTHLELYCLYLYLFIFCSSIICWKDCVFSSELPLLLCQGLVEYIYLGPFWGCLFCSINLCVNSFAKITWSWLLLLYTKSWSQIVSFLQLCYSWVFRWLATWCLESHKIICWDFDWDCVESINQVGKKWHLNKIESFYPFTQNISPFI